MGRYIAKRCVYMIAVFFILTFLLFCLYRLMPSNRAYTDARTEYQSLKRGLQDEEDLDAVFNEIYLRYQRMYGTDIDNNFLLYLRWLGAYPLYNGEYNGLFQGNFGHSYEHNAEVIDIIGDYLRNTIVISLVSEIFVLGISIPLGIQCAVKKGKRFDRGVQFLSLIGFSTPNFVVYIVFIVLFCSILGWFPVSGMHTPGANYTGWALVKDTLWHVALPAICSVFVGLATIIRITRASMIDALSLDCIRTARAKGLKEKVVIYSHAWRNALVPMVAIIVGAFFGLIGGSMVMENMFGFKGMGSLYLSSLNTQDYDMIMFIEVIYTFVGLFSGLVIDLAYGLVDPRVRINK